MLVGMTSHLTLTALLLACALVRSHRRASRSVAEVGRGRDRTCGRSHGTAGACGAGVGIRVPREELSTGSRPFDVVESPDGERVAISVLDTE
jgi:hypothetical protein